MNPRNACTYAINNYINIMRILIIISLLFLNNIILCAVFKLEDSASIDQNLISTSDKMFVMSTYESNGVFTSNTQYGGTSKCVGSNSYKKKKSDSLEESLRTINDLCAYKSGKYEFFVPFQALDFDTSKSMSIRVPIISGTGPFKYLNGNICDVAWITYDNKGFKRAYLMHLVCKISDRTLEKIINFKE